MSAETLAIYERLAKVANQSTGRAMAEWLHDTGEAAELMASTLERARAAPKIVTAELHAMMLGMADQTKEIADKFAKFKGSMADGPTRTDSAKRGPGRGGASVTTPNPPSCNTGGKVPSGHTVKPTRGKP